MRFFILILALCVAACATHHKPRNTAQEPIITHVYPPTEDRCRTLIQNAVDRMSAVDFNQDRNSEFKRYIGKARAELAKGRYDKCIATMKKAKYW